METIKVIIEPYLENTIEFTFVYEERGVEKHYTAYDGDNGLSYSHFRVKGDKSEMTDTERGIMKAVMSNR